MKILFTAFSGKYPQGKNSFIHLFLWIMPSLVLCQNIKEKPTYPWSGKTEIGLNMTNLTARFVPLNFNNQSNQDIAFKYRRYRRTNAIKMDLGGRVSDDELNGDRQFIFISAKNKKRRNIWENKWRYVSSFDFSILAGPANSFVGFARVYGIEYALTPNVYLSTQASLALGVGVDDGGGFRFLPPNSLFLNVRF